MRSVAGDLCRQPGLERRDGGGFVEREAEDLRRRLPTDTGCGLVEGHALQGIVPGGRRRRSCCCGWLGGTAVLWRNGRWRCWQHGGALGCQVDTRSWLRNSKGVACSRVARPLGSDSRPQRTGWRCGCEKATKLGHCVRPRRLALRCGCGHGCGLGRQVDSRAWLRKVRGAVCSRVARRLASDSRAQRPGWRC